jgi:hypothetical protein
MFYIIPFIFEFEQKALEKNLTKTKNDETFILCKDSP